jgi:hydrogen peroxide-dependent heme synthase
MWRTDVTSIANEERAAAHPPETAEGWFVLHQVFAFDWKAWRQLAASERAAMLSALETAWTGITTRDEGQGWSTLVQLVGSTSDLLVVHVRPTFDELSEARSRFSRVTLGDLLTPTYTFLSVTEVSLYHLTAKLADEAASRGGAFGDPLFQAQMRERAPRELASAHVTKRLYPTIPDEMPYFSFYPMSKRRTGEENWYALAISERDRLMQAHGLTGRRYAGRVSQIVTGAAGFDRWEWGITLFAKNPVDLKRIVTEMRYDEVSARFAEFGEFYAGKLCSVGELRALLDAS